MLWTKQLHLPDFILKWTVDFLTDRTQCTRVGLSISVSLAINRSTVQGSGIGPCLFIVYIFDLNGSGKSNYPIKFADDCTLLIL